MTGRLKLACQDCLFWVPIATRGGMGECRRRPPAHAFEPVGGTPSRVSPWTGAYFWCGEHSDVRAALERAVATPSQPATPDARQVGAK